MMSSSEERETSSCHDVVSLLSSPDRDYLIRRNGDQVKVDSLKRKKLGFYFSASWCDMSRLFTPVLEELYDKLAYTNDFEVVFVTLDNNAESFESYFRKMPWTAIPYTDSETIDRLDELFEVSGLPYLVILDENGSVVSVDGVAIVREYGVEGYPFAADRIKELKEQAGDTARNQSLTSLLVSPSRDFVLQSDGKMVPVSDLQGKTVALYFSSSTSESCNYFTPLLVKVHEELKAEGQSFEVVLVSVDEEEKDFKQSVRGRPWFLLPFKDKTCEKLAGYLEVSTVPTVVIIGPDGRVFRSNVARAIKEHGVEAYPFTPDKLSEIAKVEKAEAEAQTLESILVSAGDKDFVIRKDGEKIPVSDLFGKNILLYFLADWCSPCRVFLPQIIEAYQKMKEENGDAFEVIFISNDSDQASFNKLLSTMPWLALPFGDDRIESLYSRFKVRAIPKGIALGPTGKTISKDAQDVIMLHGADAYPFTKERLKEIEGKIYERSQWWHDIVGKKEHWHSFVLTRKTICIGDAEEQVYVWSFQCDDFDDCDFNLHPECVPRK